MQRYAKYGGDSGVAAFEIGDDRIIVQFNDGSLYLYTNGSAGRSNVERMKQLAKAGQGLNEYINRWVRKSYHRKLR